MQRHPNTAKCLRPHTQQRQDGRRVLETTPKRSPHALTARASKPCRRQHPQPRRRLLTPHTTAKRTTRPPPGALSAKLSASRSPPEASSQDTRNDSPGVECEGPCTEESKTHSAPGTQGGLRGAADGQPHHQAWGSACTGPTAVCLTGARTASGVPSALGALAGHSPSCRVPSGPGLPLPPPRAHSAGHSSHTPRAGPWWPSSGTSPIVVRRALRCNGEQDATNSTDSPLQRTMGLK